LNIGTCSFISQHLWEIDKNTTEALSIKDHLKLYAQSLIEEKNITRFFILMDAGIPLDAGAAILELRAQYPITLDCVIPFEEQHVLWSEEERNRYFSILEQCDNEHMLQHHFSIDCYQRGNKYMVAHASLLLIFYNGRQSDASDAIHEARKKGRHILVLSSEQFCQTHA
jgi:uncharacterized phage-like protein YoqJ